MLAIVRLADRAYPVAIRDEIVARTGIELRRGGIYEALERLERAGYLRSHEGPATDARGGRPTRVFAVTGDGIAAMQETDRVVGLMRATPRPMRGTR